MQPGATKSGCEHRNAICAVAGYKKTQLNKQIMDHADDMMHCLGIWKRRLRISGDSPAKVASEISLAECLTYHISEWESERFQIQSHPDL